MDLHFHDLRHTFATWLQNLGVPLEVRATLLGHRLQGSGTDQLGGEVMTSRYSHGGYGWNQQLRYAVTLLHTALLSYGLSYGRSADEASSQLKVANAPKDEGKVWWFQRDLNPCLSLESALTLEFGSPCPIEFFLRHQLFLSDIPSGYETRKPASNDSDPATAAQPVRPIRRLSH
jgi:hypothetical protein